MKVLVDTSVWVDFFNRFSSPEAEELTRLIEAEIPVLTCGVVIAEFFQGVRRGDSLAELEKHFRAMDCLKPREPETYLEAATLFRQLRERGITIRSTIDCLIARLAEEHSVLLLAKDRDLRLIAESGLCQFQWLGQQHATD